MRPKPIYWMMGKAALKTFAHRRGMPSADAHDGDVVWSGRTVQDLRSTDANAGPWFLYGPRSGEPLLSVADALVVDPETYRRFPPLIVARYNNIVWRICGTCRFTALHNYPTNVRDVARAPCFVYILAEAPSIQTKFVLTVNTVSRGFRQCCDSADAN